MFAGIIRHGTLVAVITLILAILGTAAALRIPVQMIPDLETRTVTVETRWPGATPQDIEKEILIEQERYLRNVPNLTRMISSASFGASEIELEFPFGVDITEALIQINNALSQVSDYPRNVDEPRIVAASFSANAFMYFRISTLIGNPRELDIDLMRDFVEDRVRPRMESVPGVSEVTVGGGAERQVQITVDELKLAQRGLSLLDLRDAITARNRDLSGGEIDSGKRSYLLRTLGRFEDLEELEQLVVSRTGDSLVRLSDVASVRQDHSRIRALSFVNGQRVLGLQVRRESGSNVIDIKRAMLTEVDAINREVLEPAGLRLDLTSDDARYVEASVANVWTNLGIGALFASLVLFLFLRSSRATLVAVIGIPLCTIAAFMGLLIAGRTINVISLAGIAFAIGMTVDNSIVVLENIERHRRLGLNRFDSALKGVQEVWPAVLASTMTTILVFLPILFIEEEAGQLYSDVAIAISAAILASMLVAVTLVPTLSARMGFGVRETVADGSGNAPFGGRVGGWADGIVGVVRWLIGSAVRRVLTILVTVALSLWIILTLTPPAEYLPEGEEPKTFASMNAPPGYNLSEMEAIAKQIEDHFLPHLGAESDAFDAGEVSVPPIAFLNMQVSPTNVRIIAETIDPLHIEPLMDEITGFYEQFPGMRSFAAKGSIISSNDGGTRSINLDISGPDLVSTLPLGQRRRRTCPGDLRQPAHPDPTAHAVSGSALDPGAPGLESGGRAGSGHRGDRLHHRLPDRRGVPGRFLPRRRQDRHLSLRQSGPGASPGRAAQRDDPHARRRHLAAVRPGNHRGGRGCQHRAPGGRSPHRHPECDSAGRRAPGNGCRAREGGAAGRHAQQWRAALGRERGDLRSQ